MGGADNFFILAEIWDALHAAAEADITMAQAIVDSAGVIVQSADLTICYDERGIIPLSLSHTVSIDVHMNGMA